MEWISVEDRTPPEGKLVLLNGNDGVFRGYRCGDNESWQCSPIGSYAGDGCVFGITHWMDLPAPPEVKKKMISGSVSFNFSVDEKYLLILDKLSSQKITNLEVINSISRFLNLDGEFELSTNYFHVKLLSPED